jgi:aspartyl-tRNA(Asn)/glutamyl-tRNA(Gln) amidotransferase subunit A
VSDADLTYTTIADLGPRLASGALSPVELTRACLDRIAAMDGSINAFITVLEESALAEARQAEQEIRGGHYRGPLHGIPIAHKDLFYTRGVRTTAGSKILADFAPDFDGTVVDRLRTAGTVLLGKLNMHELAAGGTSDNPHYGPVHNPWDVGCHPGGSSGGSAAALAAGMCYATTGSDTAGSIRIPSSACGTTGIKPTYGRVSCYGVVPLSWSLDHVGPMTRSVRDAAVMLNVMAGYDHRDAASVDQPMADYTADLDLGLHGLRVGIPTSYFSELLQADVEHAWRAALNVLVGLGAEPVDVSFTEVARSPEVGPPIVRAEMATYHEAWFEAHPDAYGPSMHQRMAIGRELSAIDLVKAQRARELIRAELWAAFEAFDVLLTPTMPVTATPIGDETVDINGQQHQLSTELSRFTYPFNLSRFPALSVPCGFDRHGLPIGLQLAALPWQEALLFRVGSAYQQATDWHLQRPSGVQPVVGGEH